MSKINSNLASKGGALNRYKLTVTGNTSNLSLLQYEWFSLFITPVPGLVGTILRKLFYPLVFKKIGKNCKIEANCTIRQASKVSFGSGVKVGNYVTLDVRPGGAGIVIDDDVTIGEKSIIISSQDILHICRNVQLGRLCRVGAIQTLTIGKNSIIGDEVCFVAAGHTYEDTSTPIIDQPISTRGSITIGERVTIGDRATIMDGVTVGNNVHIAPNSFVNKDLPDDSRVAGVPAQIL